jgi:hypothetical protein
MKNKLLILLAIYGLLMLIGWFCINDSTKLQTWAIIVSGFILIWYSWETRLLRVIASDQKDQQIQPLIIYENRRAGHYINPRFSNRNRCLIVTDQFHPLQSCHF